MHNKRDVMEAERERQMDVSNVSFKHFLKSNGDGFRAGRLAEQR